MPGTVVEAVLTAVVVLLLLNFAAALAVFARRRLAGSWLLVVLLTGTTGAALAAVIALLTPEGERFADVALVLTGTAAVTAAVRAAAERRRVPQIPQAAGHPTERENDADAASKSGESQ